MCAGCLCKTFSASLCPYESFMSFQSFGNHPLYFQSLAFTFQSRHAKTMEATAAPIQKRKALSKS